MRNIQLWSPATDRKLTWIFLAAIVFLLGMGVVRSCRRTYTFNHFEERTRQVVTGSELQQWGMKILTEHPVPADKAYLSLRPSELRTPLPRQLLDLYHNQPGICVYETTTNSPGYVMLMWGGAVIGHCGFEIGPTNFIGYRGQHKWQDGVYFWTEK